MTQEAALGVRPHSVAAWILATRPRTLGASLSPVAVGASLAFAQDVGSPAPALLCAVVAAGLQIAANLANDWADWRSGTDKDRIGPPRACASGLLRPTAVLTAAVVSALIACVAGLVVLATADGVTPIWWLAAALLPLAALGYSFGPLPLSRLGVGEVAAFVFFGPVPVLATLAVQAGGIDAAAVVLATAQGGFAATLLGVNNLRDVETDAAAGKHTSAVVFGARPVSAVLCVVLAWALAAPAVTALTGSTDSATAVAVAAAVLAAPVFQVLGRGRTGRAAAGALLPTARTQVVATLLTLPGLLW